MSQSKESENVSQRTAVDIMESLWEKDSNIPASKSKKIVGDLSSDGDKFVMQFADAEEFLEYSMEELRKQGQDISDVHLPQLRTMSEHAYETRKRRYLIKEDQRQRDETEKLLKIANSFMLGDTSDNNVKDGNNYETEKYENDVIMKAHKASKSIGPFSIDYRELERDDDDVNTSSISKPLLTSDYTSALERGDSKPHNRSNTSTLRRDRSTRKSSRSDEVCTCPITPLSPSWWSQLMSEATTIDTTITDEDINDSINDEKITFHDNLFDCFKNLWPSCICVYTGGCLQFYFASQIAARIGIGLGYIKTILFYYILVFTAIMITSTILIYINVWSNPKGNVLDKDMRIALWITYIPYVFTLLYYMYIRIQFVKRFHIDEGLWDSVYYSIFCLPCSICQMARHLWQYKYILDGDARMDGSMRYELIPTNTTTSTTTVTTTEPV